MTLIQPKRAVILAHYDRDGLLDDHVRASLSSLAATGMEIVVVSTNLALAETLAGCGVQRVVRRANQGYDFRSWQIGLHGLGELEAYDEVVLMNDSFYLAREDALVVALAALRRRRYDVAAMTASREICAHLQSYFMVFRPAALRSGWFRQFWANIAPDSGRAAAIRDYELTMASQARSAGLTVGALMPWRGIPDTGYLAHSWMAGIRQGGWRSGARAVRDTWRGSPGINPTLHTWVSLGKRHGIVKVQLLRDNPHGADLSRLSSIMEPACLARARNHLARITRPATRAGNAG